MAFTKKIPDDLMPFRAGFLRVTPYDSNGKLVRERTISTNWDYVQSIQHTAERTYLSKPNGNGQDGEFVESESHTIILTTDVFNPEFNAAVAGFRTRKEAGNIMHRIVITPKSGSGSAEYTFTDEAEYPAKSEDGKEHFEIRDSYGNLLKEAQDSPATDDYKYESAGHKLTFPSAYVDTPLTVVYDIAASEGAISFEADPLLKTDTFLVEVTGITQSASKPEKQRVYSRVERASISGGIPDLTTQKPITNNLTYTFKSKPVPEGVTPFVQTFDPIKEAPAAAAASTLKVPAKK